MKIGLLSTSFFGLPPASYGGAELVTWNTAKGLIARGHKVILYAPDNSQIPEKGFLYKTGPALNAVNVNWLEEEKKDWEAVKHTFGDLDVLMGDNWFGWEYASKPENPNLKVCHRHHGHINYWLDAERKNPWWAKPAPFKLNMIAISQHMKRLYDSGYNGAAPRIPSEYCYNGIDISLYPYQRDKGDRLLFLGRIDPIKGVHTAIEVAEKSCTPIDIVGATEFVANKQYVEDMKRRCAESKYARFVGEVSHQDKVKYLQNAKALIAASTFSEPFGLHFAEAGSCGTKVITTNDGAAGEVVAHDETGFVCNSVDEMVDAVKRLDSLDSVKCHERVERLFSLGALGARTEELYKRILSGNAW
jgi:glycosyltransferase involved in cell wall biosynthesis